MHTPDIAEQNYKKLAALFPDAITETTDEDGNIIRAIDKDVLMQEINTKVIDDGQERYQFTWPDKRKSMVMANAPISKTLRLEKEKSVGRDGTPGGVDSENIYIEGDNLDALKLLQETYLGKVKMIYIDPPYNTGKDRIYKDNFFQKVSDYLNDSNQTDEEGNRLVVNTDSSGRFHTDWLNMMYPRLRIAKNFLANDGIIFVSIDESEASNLKKIMEEIFGQSNYLTDIIWKHTQQSKNDEPHFSKQYNHIITFAKDINSLGELYFERSAKDNKNYSNPDSDPKGAWRSGDVRSPNYRETLRYTVTAPNGNIIQPPSNGWRWSENSLKEKIKTGEIKFKKDNSGIIRKIYLCNQPGRTPENLWEGSDFGTTRQATALIKQLFNGVQVFDTPKPIELINKMLQIASDKEAIILDFFSGSATTAHAVMQQNYEDGGKRKYILIELPQTTNSVAYKAGYNTTCDIGEERIRRSSKKIREETGADIDYGFRCFKVDSTNMKDVYYDPAHLEQLNLDGYVDNIKNDRTSEDLLIQVMLDLGILLSSDIETQEINEKKVFSVADGYLLACFDKDVTEETVIEIAKKKPFYAVFRDNSIANDSVAANFEQIFETYSPETVRKVL